MSYLSMFKKRYAHVEILCLPPFIANVIIENTRHLLMSFYRASLDVDRGISRGLVAYLRRV